MAQEGYALDWSGVEEGRLAAGDCAAAIRVWEPNQKGGWSVGPAYKARCCTPLSSPSVPAHACITAVL
jgi:hypothetical protein